MERKLEESDLRLGNDTWLDGQFSEVKNLAEQLPDLKEVILNTANLLIEKISLGGKVMFCGNGGSAGDAQHLATELVGRQNYSRRALPGLALTTDSSCLTALANDDGYETVFARQIQALAKPQDVLIGISTSGRSINVLKAFEAARTLGVVTVAFVGLNKSPMHELADVVVAIPATKTAHIQEGHITVGQMVCGLVERTLCPLES